MTTPRVARCGAVLIATLALTLTVAGCAPASSEAEGTPSTKPAATTGARPTPTPTPVPTSTLEPVADATCLSVLTDRARADVEAGYELFPLPPSDAVMESMTASGGFSCFWATGPSTEASTWYAQVAMDAATWDAKKAEFLGAGYTESADPIPGILNGPRSGDDFPALAYRDGLMYYVSYPHVFTSLAALQ